MTVRDRDEVAHIHMVAHRAVYTEWHVEWDATSVGRKHG